MKRILIAACLFLAGCKTGGWDPEVTRANIEICERLGMKPVLEFWQGMVRVSSCEQIIQQAPTP